MKNMKAEKGNEADTIVQQSQHLKLTERDSKNPEVEINESLRSRKIKLLASNYNHPFN